MIQKSPDTQGVILLALRVLSAPFLILGGSVVQGRFGQSVGGKLIGLPLTSLPVLILLSLSEGRHFAGTAAAATLCAAVAQSIWCLTYALTARRAGPVVSLLVSSGIFASGCLILFRFMPPALVSILIATASVIVTLCIWPGAGPSDERSQNRSDIWVRALVGTVFTVGLTATAATLGAKGAGFLTAYPVLTIVLTVGTHIREGSATASRFLRGVMSGSLSVVAAIAVVALTLTSLGALFSFALAILASLLAQLIPMDWTLKVRSFGIKTGSGLHDWTEGRVKVSDLDSSFT